MKPNLILCALGAAATLAACSLAPPYRTPVTAAPAAAYKEADGWKPAQPADTLPRGPWWNIFHDAQLDSLEAQVTTSNCTTTAGTSLTVRLSTITLTSVMALGGSRIPPADLLTTTFRMVGFNTVADFPAARGLVCTPASSADSIMEASHMDSLPGEARVSAAVSMVVEEGSTPEA